MQHILSNIFFKQYVKHDKTERMNEYDFQSTENLNNPAASAKAYRTILKAFCSGKKYL